LTKRHGAAGARHESCAPGTAAFARAGLHACGGGSGACLRRGPGDGWGGPSAAPESLPVCNWRPASGPSAGRPITRALLSITGPGRRARAPQSRCPAARPGYVQSFNSVSGRTLYLRGPGVRGTPADELEGDAAAARAHALKRPSRHVTVTWSRGTRPRGAGAVGPGAARA
jgi:hypothetical protein